MPFVARKSPAPRRMLAERVAVPRRGMVAVDERGRDQERDVRPEQRASALPRRAGTRPPRSRRRTPASRTRAPRRTGRAVRAERLERPGIERRPDPGQAAIQDQRAGEDHLDVGRQEQDRRPDRRDDGRQRQRQARPREAVGEAAPDRREQQLDGGLDRGQRADLGELEPEVPVEDRQVRERGADGPRSRRDRRGGSGDRRPWPGVRLVRGRCPAARCRSGASSRSGRRATAGPARRPARARPGSRRPRPRRSRPRPAVRPSSVSHITSRRASPDRSPRLPPTRARQGGPGAGPAPPRAPPG